MAGYFPGELQTKPIIIERKPTVVKEQKHFGETLETAVVSSDKGASGFINECFENRYKSDVKTL